MQLTSINLSPPINYGVYLENCGYHYTLKNLIQLNSYYIRDLENICK